MDKKHRKPTNKIIIFIGGIVAIVIIAIVSIILIPQIKENSINVDISSDSINVDISSDGYDGGYTDYKVTGAKSEIEANRAIIKKVYSDSEYFRAITESELQDITNKISSSGCGQITVSHALGPPLDGAVHWTNFSNDNHDDIVVYMLDDRYSVYTKCSNR